MSERAWVIVGCGYVGTRAARMLAARGAQVIATRRSEQALARLRGSVPESVELRQLDLADPVALSELVPAGAAVLVAAPPTEGARHESALGAALRGRNARIIYLSSTGVYPPAGGEKVDEESAVGPVGDLGRRRLAAERAVFESARAAGVEVVALRISGIYGPGRGSHERIRLGEYRVIGPGDSLVCRIHVDDLVQAIYCAGVAPTLECSIYIVSDDAPSTSRACADGIAEMFGLPPPPSVSPGEVSSQRLAMLTANRHLDNSRMKSELGVRLAYPSWREGMRQILDEESE